MSRWWSDTLFKRLFVLLWVALIGSHLLGYAVAHWSGGAPLSGPPGGGITREALPSLPPGLTPGGPGARGPGTAPPGPSPDGHGPGGPNVRGEDRPIPPDGRPGPRFKPPADDTGPDGPPQHSLWLDYAARILVIGLAAWFGARWLSAPMRRLAAASQALGESLSQSQPAPRLDDGRGTAEVRQAARVFNGMAERLRQQFDTRSLYMAALSHDLRTPMTRMRMRLEQRADDALMQRCIADLHEMDGMIDAVLDALRDERAPEAGQRVDVHAVVQSLVDDLAELSQAASVSGTAAVTRTAPTALRRIVSNLVGNALRYAGSAEVKVTREAQQVLVQVDDNGPGIPPDQLEVVMLPFHRLEVSRNRGTGGIGLGLYIARELSERHGMQLKLSNRPEGGLRAELALPLHD